MSVFGISTYIEHFHLLSFFTAELMPLSCFYMKHKTKLKCKRYMALYNPRDLNDTYSYQLKCLMRELTLVMRKQHSTATVNLVTLYFQLRLLLLSM